MTPEREKQIREATKQAMEFPVSTHLKATVSLKPEIAEELLAEIDRLRGALSEITSLPCDSDKYPDCKVCRSIDVIVHAGLNAGG